MAFRTDIQALRGLAVLLVVFYHARLFPIGAGYLGVDIFFVISGFLITRMVKEAIEQGTFRFSEFYFRRAKRLLPAAYVTFLVTAVLAVFLLDGRELRDFAMQLAGAITFTGNIVLWRQSGYFEGAAALKPLLHVWSLSLEEQYYLLLPATMVFVPRRFWLPGAGLLVIASLALCLVLVPVRPEAAFYLLPTRTWELGIGSLAALNAFTGKTAQVIVARLLWPAVVALILIPILPIGTAHPGMDAMIVCIATVLVILRRHDMLNNHPAPRALAKVGDFSYSLYLAHWPVFAFLNNAYVNEPPVGVHVAAVALALILGYLLYRYVELPVRRLKSGFSVRLAGATVGTSLALMLVPFGIASAYAPAVDYAQIRRTNYGFGVACESDDRFTAKSECRNASDPMFMVWGDSFAMHLVPGIAATTDRGVVQATRSACGPFIGLAPTDNTVNTKAWAQDCIAFNQSVFDYLAAHSSIEVVVLSSTFAQYLDAPLDVQLWGRNRKFRALDLVDGQWVEHEARDARALEVMSNTIEKLRALGKRVVVVAPPPSSGFDTGRCMERKATGKPILGVDGRCTILVADYQTHQAAVLRFLGRLPQAGVDVVYFNEALCAGPVCETERNGTFIYRDGGHFSIDGSRAVAQQMRLAGMLQARAR